jgi:hypothetical protein
MQGSPAHFFPQQLHPWKISIHPTQQLLWKIPYFRKGVGQFSPIIQNASNNLFLYFKPRFILGNSTIKFTVILVVTREREREREREHARQFW